MVKKKILVILCILIMLISISKDIIAKISPTTAGTKLNFGITLTHTSNTLDKKKQVKFGYRIDTKNVYRIFSGNNDYSTTLCLDKEGKFPSDEGNSGQYTSLGPATDATLKSAKSSIDATGAKKIQWLIKNAVIPEDSDELKNQKLAKIFNDTMKSTEGTENPLTLDEIKSILTEDDLVFALQYTVWGITNNLQESRPIQGTDSDTGSYWDSLQGQDRWGYEGKKDEFIKKIISYYNTQLKGNLNDDTSQKTNPTFDNKDVTANIVGGRTIVGPFHINSSSSTNYYSVHITFKDASDRPLEGVRYLLTSKNSSVTTSDLLAQTKEDLEGKDFYVSVPTSTSARKIKIQLVTQITTTSAVGTVWTDGNSGDQGLLSIERSETSGTNVEIEKQFDITITKKYDASLRKYIYGKETRTSLGQWKVQSLDKLGQPTRTPSKSALNSAEGRFNQYDYTHKKDPVQFAVGERVIYKIVVTNECDNNLIVTSITDYLPPSGLEYASDDSNNTANAWVYNAVNKSYTTNKTNKTILQPGDSTEVTIVFTVTSDAVGKIVTNIAEITQISDDGGQTVQDIDSDPGNVTRPTEEIDWQQYKGNTSMEFKNKDELNDSSYYYKGQQDDDDFEKIVVPGKIDLALRKSITKVNQQTHDRKKAPGTEPLRDNSDATTTSNFTDVKTPVEVKVGDIVTYSIRVYNEGTEDAYVGAIEDYIPAGLGYLTQHKTNIENGWQVQGNINKIKLSEINNAVNNITQDSFATDVEDYKNAEVVTGKATIKSTIIKDDIIPAFNSKTNILSGKELEIVCVVLNSATPDTIIKNISAITEYRNKEHKPVTPDIDSDTTTAINPDTYPSDDTHIQDDDDFEKLILKISSSEYKVQILKVDKDSPSTRLDGAEFNITLPSQSPQKVRTANGGTYTTGNIAVTKTGIDTITINEITPPNGYGSKIIGNIEIEVIKQIEGGAYKATTARLKNQVTGASVALTGNTVTITIQNEKLAGQYNVQLIKVDKDNQATKLDGAEFDITLPGKSSADRITTSGGGIYTSPNIQITGPGTDTITIKEITPPNGYNKIIDSIQIDVTKETQSGAYKATGAKLKTQVTGASVQLNGTTVTVTIQDEKIKGQYNVQLIKVDKDNKATRLDGAEFELTLPGTSGTQKVTTASGGTYTSGNIQITAPGTDTITIREITPPKGYKKLIDSIQIDVTKALQGTTYKATGAKLKTQATGASVEVSGNTIVVTVQNEKLKGKYNLQLLKVDKDNNNNKLQGVEFDITLPNGTTQKATTDQDGIIKIENIEISDITKDDVIKLKETKSATGYNLLNEEIQINVKKVAENEAYIAKEATLLKQTENAEVNLKNTTVEVTVKNKKSEFFDLALKKFITKVTSSQGTERTLPENQRRFIEVADSTPLMDRENNPKADAKYNLNKTPVEVAKEDTVIYTIRVFNEGLTDGIVKEIVDTVPDGLEFVKYEKNADGSYKSGSQINYQYGWETFVNQDDPNKWQEGVRTSHLENTVIKAFDKTQTTDAENKIEKGISYADVQIEFKVVTNEHKQLINIAEITEDNGDDNDSTPNNKEETEDDEDYDVVIPQIFDLALKKFITKVTSSQGTEKTLPEDQKRFIEVTDSTPLMDRDSNPKADAKYNLNKTPVEVAKEDTVIYTIRVFNEGLTDGIVKEIVDTVPDGLEFVKYEKNADGSYKSGSQINYQYGWETFINQDDPNKWQEGVRTRHLENTVIKAFDKTQTTDAENKKEKGISYADVQIEFKVVTDEHRQLINIAEITEDNGDDNDSTPNNKEEQEDDEDYDVVIPQKFDLALRKFITQIDEKDVTDRIPEVSYENGKLKYNHTKEPKLVVEGQTVIYTLRVYNEGSIDGYAAEIKDDLPKEITFLPEHQVNQKYGWKMYDNEGNETTDVTKAVVIRTKYLSKEESEARNEDNLLKAFNSELNINDQNPDYREVKAAFKVTIDSVTNGNRIIVNTAQISEDQDENGNPIDDTDSTPDNDKEDEDDIDKEYLQMKYFDLSLLKYVSKVIVTEDGKTKETKTGYDGTENPEPVVKVELNKKKLKKTTVKYEYSIKITNEGEIEGYATEITDRIPDGLEFFEEDNTEYNWKISEDGQIATDYLKDQLLKPGESAIVPIVLRWKRSATNLGQKVNVAEITKDKNEYGIPDIDSTPNNKIEGEDDQDLAIVVLSLSTGSNPMYIIIGISILTLIGTGIACYAIYNNVIKKRNNYIY